MSPVNGKIAIPPAVLAVGTPTIVNGNTPMSSTLGAGDHSRKPSVTISAAGASGYLPNGGPVAGKPKGGRDIQFGSAVPEGSAAAANAAPQPNNSAASLAVNMPSNPRVSSPQKSPSPIPKPHASGGRPPSSLHGNNASVSFGNFAGPEGNVSRGNRLRHGESLTCEFPQMRAPGATQGPLAPGPQTSHLRRESSQSQHSDMSNHAMGSAVGRGGYPPQGGRGRGGFQGQYSQQQMQASGFFSPNSRPPPNQPRAGLNIPPYQGQNRNLAPFPNSPHQSNRSPVPPNAQLAHPQPGQVPMASPQMGGQPYGYSYPYVGYPQNMGPPQVNPQSSSLVKHKVHNFVAKENQPSFPSTPRTPRPDFSPATGNFERILTFRSQGQYGISQGYDQNFIPAQYNQFYMGNMPPSSPRPAQQMTPGPQQYHPGQYGTPQQPPSMSRESSSVSHTDRPGSSIGRPQAGSTTPAIGNTGPPGRQANSPAPKPNSNFQLPQKKKAAPLKIVNPDTGETVTFDKQAASPAPRSKSQTPAITSTPTPPPRTPSHTDSQHSRTESKSVKTDEEKRNEMRDAIARKMEADKAEEQRQKLEEESKASQDSKDAEKKILKEKEEADKQQREATQAREMDEEALKEDKAEAEEAEEAAAKAKEEANEAAEKARKEQEQEDEFARIEAEYAEIERKEKEDEERYQQKKNAEKEEAARKEAEAFKMEDEEMKRAEREAEEAEEARLKELEKPEGDDSQKERENMFAALKKDGSATPASDTQAAEESQVDSGIATPASDAPAAPSQPLTSVGKKRPADLKLDIMKPVEAAQPTPQLDSLRSARMIQRIEDISYPADIASPNPALNRTAPTGKFRYGKDFLLQFETKFTEKPSVNWDARLKETVGDTTEPSSARTPARGSAGGSSIMGGRQASHRGPPSQPAMGNFAQGGRTLPPSTSSQQRLEATPAGRSAAPSRQTMTNPLANFVPNRTGGFPQPAGMSVKMDRTPSSTSLNHPNSPRNASQRGGSQRGSRAAAQREKPGDNSKMPLTANTNLKPIEVTAGGWKPRSVGQNATGMAGPAPGGNGHMDPEQVQRKVKSNLNKMTPEKFEKISEQILEISAQSKDESDGRTLRQVIQLTFEKATDESHWAEMYAQFCKRMLESMSPEIKDENILDKKGEVVHGGALFRKYLLNRCQEEFEAGWKLNLGDKPEGETEEAVMLSDAYYKEAAAKRRGLGLVRFIGELYKLGMLTERIMHECVKKLVDYEGVPDESEVESLTSLLRTIGRPLDSTDKGTKFVDAYFTKINEMIVIEGLPSRLRFMLMVSTASRHFRNSYLQFTGYRRSSKERMARKGQCCQGTHNTRCSSRTGKCLPYCNLCQLH